jgi:hypothetical protein
MCNSLRRQQPRHWQENGMPPSSMSAFLDDCMQAYTPCPIKPVGKSRCQVRLRTNGGGGLLPTSVEPVHWMAQKNIGLPRPAFEVEIGDATRLFRHSNIENDHHKAPALPHKRVASPLSSPISLFPNTAT